eukprot:jgi/Mesen1/10659/ME000009S10451
MQGKTLAAFAWKLLMKKNLLRAQRSRECPMCWQSLSLKDPDSQELLAACSQERAFKAQSVSPPAFLGSPFEEFGFHRFATSYPDDPDLERRIIHHLAAAAAGMSRARLTGGSRRSHRSLVAALQSASGVASSAPSSRSHGGSLVPSPQAADSPANSGGSSPAGTAPPSAHASPPPPRRSGRHASSSDLPDVRNSLVGSGRGAPPFWGASLGHSQSAPGPGGAPSAEGSAGAAAAAAVSVSDGGLEGLAGAAGGGEGGSVRPAAAARGLTAGLRGFGAPREGAAAAAAAGGGGGGAAESGSQRRSAEPGSLSGRSLSSGGNKSGRSDSPGSCDESSDSSSRRPPGHGTGVDGAASSSASVRRSFGRSSCSSFGSDAGGSHGSALASASAPADSLKSRLAAASSRAKENFSKGTRSFRERLRLRSGTVADFSAKAREVGATVARAFERISDPSDPRLFELGLAKDTSSAGPSSPSFLKGGLDREEEKSGEQFLPAVSLRA